MIWIILNIALLMAGIGLIAVSHYVSEINDYVLIPEDILLLRAVGVICLAFLVVSESLRWWLG